MTARLMAKMVTIGLTAALVTGIAMFSHDAGARGQTTGGDRHAATAVARSFNCPDAFWCDFVYDNGTELCFEVSPFAGPYNVPNWGTYGCRNVDGSIDNNTPFTLRIYFSPNYGDPHACIDPFTKISNLFNYDFNSGSGPHDYVIGNDIASSTMSLNRCTNPL
jgi:hypothetical protein